MNKISIKLDYDVETETLDISTPLRVGAVSHYIDVDRITKELKRMCNPNLYHCRDNDVELRKENDEIHVGIAGRWTVVGIADLKAALHKFKLDTYQQAEKFSNYAAYKAPRAFRKKPVIVKAMRLTEDNLRFVVNWIRICEHKGEATNVRALSSGSKGILIGTLEGDMKARFGDWVVQGIDNEFYPVKDNIFRKTYQSV